MKQKTKNTLLKAFSNFLMSLLVIATTFSLAYYFAYYFAKGFCAGVGESVIINIKGSIETSK